MRFKLRIDHERCKGCALCEAACERAVIRMSKKLNSRGQPLAETSDEGRCTGCRQCADVCPDGAIEIDREDS
jgi:2-oxoglutarate ferredoxin oxidoreductase subunit delta